LRSRVTRKGKALFGIRLQEGGAGVTVGMWGEFDVSSWPRLREALDDASAFDGPAVVDLSRITFLDLQSTRELVVRSLIQAHQLVFRNPSPGVLASVRALGMQHETRVWHGPDREEPPVFSDA
jgi:anti-anti-sigma regulatory factor